MPWHAMAYAIACAMAWHGMSWHAMAYPMVCHGISDGMPWYRAYPVAYARACHSIWQGILWHIPWHAMAHAREWQSTLPWHAVTPGHAMACGTECHGMRHSMRIAYPVRYHAFTVYHISETMGNSKITINHHKMLQAVI